MISPETPEGGDVVVGASPGEGDGEGVGVAAASGRASDAMIAFAWARPDLNAAGAFEDVVGAVTCAFQLPDESAVTLVGVPPAVTVTVAPGVAVPETSG